MTLEQLSQELGNLGYRITNRMLSSIELGEYPPSEEGFFVGVSTDFLMAVAIVFAEREGVTPVEFAETLLTKRLWETTGMKGRSGGTIT